MGLNDRSSFLVCGGAETWRKRCVSDREDAHMEGKVAFSLWGILHPSRLCFSGVGYTELDMRPEPANRLRVIRESQFFQRNWNR